MESELWFDMAGQNGASGTAEAQEGNLDEGTLVDPTLVDPTAVAGSARRRRPQAKLTAELLVGDRGLPYVMKNAPKRIRISKRRTAYDNLSHIVQFYQLWAHDLFPKARFDDFIKLCHSLGKSDKLLREHRKNLYRDEIFGQESVERMDERRTHAEDLDDEDIYAATSRPPAEAPAEAPSEAPVEELSQPAEQEAYLDTQEVFEEDEDAMEAMRELGF